MRGRGDKNDNHRHFNNMQRHSRLPRRASAATMALYNDKDTPGRLGAFRSTKGAALGSSYRTGTCFVRRGQMSPIMFSDACGHKSQNNSRTENIVVKPSAARNCVWCHAIASHCSSRRPQNFEFWDDSIKEKNNSF